MTEQEGGTGQNGEVKSEGGTDCCRRGMRGRQQRQPPGLLLRGECVSLSSHSQCARNEVADQEMCTSSLLRQQLLESFFGYYWLLHFSGSFFHDTQFPELSARRKTTAI